MNKKAYEHDFKNGNCTKCKAREGEKGKLCPVIGKEEVAEFKDNWLE